MGKVSNIINWFRCLSIILFSFQISTGVSESIDDRNKELKKINTKKADSKVIYNERLQIYMYCDFQLFSGNNTFSFKCRLVWRSMKRHAKMKIKEQNNLLVEKTFCLQNKKSSTRKSENWVLYHQMPLKCTTLFTILFKVTKLLGLFLTEDEESIYVFYSDQIPVLV